MHIQPLARNRVKKSSIGAQTPLYEINRGRLIVDRDMHKHRGAEHAIESASERDWSSRERGADDPVNQLWVKPLR